MSQRHITNYFRQLFGRSEVVENGIDRPENLTFLNMSAAPFFSLDDGRTYSRRRKLVKGADDMA